MDDTGSIPNAHERRCGSHSGRERRYELGGAHRIPYVCRRLERKSKEAPQNDPAPPRAKRSDALGNQSGLRIGPMETDALNTLVTDAIWRAQELEAVDISAAPQAWAEVSSIEEELARPSRRQMSKGRSHAAARSAQPSKLPCAKSWSRAVKPPKIFRTFRPSPAL